MSNGIEVFFFFSFLFLTNSSSNSLFSNYLDLIDRSIFFDKLRFSSPSLDIFFPLNNYSLYRDWFSRLVDNGFMSAKAKKKSKLIRQNDFRNLSLYTNSTNFLFWNHLSFTFLKVLISKYTLISSDYYCHLNYYRLYFRHNVSAKYTLTIIRYLLFGFCLIFFSGI